MSTLRSSVLIRSSLNIIFGICTFYCNGWENIVNSYQQAFTCIRIHHECEGGMEKSVPRITDWYHKACRVMTIGDREGQIFLSHPHTNNGFFFLPLNTSFYTGKT